jgi:hypothetical protein
MVLKIGNCLLKTMKTGQNNTKIADKAGLMLQLPVIQHQGLTLQGPLLYKFHRSPNLEFIVNF